MTTAIDAAMNELATLFEADGYRLESRTEGERIEVRVIATDTACADCLVPKNVMQTIMLNVFTQHGAGVAADQLVLQYPGDV